MKIPFHGKKTGKQIITHPPARFSLPVYSALMKLSLSGVLSSLMQLSSFKITTLKISQNHSCGGYKVKKRHAA
jgi:hypothetical protein